MCGLAGYMTRGTTGPSDPGQILHAMGTAIAHRGPDSHGRWVDVERGIGLSHRRLAIVDLSPHGAQPMVSTCGRFVIAFNGEIYNHLELRATFDGHPWRGHSDTETLLACFSRDGVHATLPRLVGMFAIAVWDRQATRLTLVRDRLGEKPLYHGHLPGGTFVFGSELKALRAHPAWRDDIDRDALALYMRHNCVPAPHTIYRGIAKLLPGTWLDVAHGEVVARGVYWDARALAAEGRRDPLALDDGDAVSRLEDVLGRAIEGQMVADVPLGAFLSGGVDSSAVVALMQQRSRTPVRTFTIGFGEAAYNEADQARAVARHLGTTHAELYVSAQDALAVIPSLPSIYDEPFADSSQIPTYLLSRMTREQVTVSLSGDGGDELFAGYNRYLIAERMWHLLAKVPAGLRQSLARGLLSPSPATWDRTGALLPGGAARRHANLGDKVHKFAANVLPATSLDDLYLRLVSHWQRPTEVVLGACEPPTVLGEVRIDDPYVSPVEQMSLLDQLTYLPDDILTKVDRAAMAVGLETRVPMLDHRVVEFAWQVPMHQKIRGGETKWLLRQMLYRHVPREMIERPKQGFGVPLDQWLRGPLRDWVESLLDERRLRDEGFFHADAVRQRWLEHLSGARNWQHHLWDVLMFQAWRESL